jgi:hypothetical protein
MGDALDWVSSTLLGYGESKPDCEYSGAPRSMEEAASDWRCLRCRSSQCRCSFTSAPEIGLISNRRGDGV